MYQRHCGDEDPGAGGLDRLAPYRTSAAAAPHLASATGVARAAHSAGAAVDVQLLDQRRYILQDQRRNHVEDPALEGFIARHRPDEYGSCPTPASAVGAVRAAHFACAAINVQLLV